MIRVKGLSVSLAILSETISQSSSQLNGALRMVSYLMKNLMILTVFSMGFNSPNADSLKFKPTKISQSVKPRKYFRKGKRSFL